MQQIKKYIFDFVSRLEYKLSFKKAAKDVDVMNIAEEGMTDYFQQLKNY